MLTLLSTAVEGRGVNWQGSTGGFAYVVDRSLRKGEDTTFDVQRSVPMVKSLLKTTAPTSAQVTASAAIFAGIECSSGSLLVSIYDGTAASSVPIFSRTVSTYAGFYPQFPIYCPSGMFISTTAGSSAAGTLDVLGLAST